MQLVYAETSQPVQKGDLVTMRDGDKAIVESIEKPRHGGSTGRVYVRHGDGENFDGESQGYYPSVIGAVWINRDDQGE